MFSFNCWGAGTNSRADGPAFLWYSTRLTAERNAICAAPTAPFVSGQSGAHLALLTARGDAGERRQFLGEQVE